MFGVKPLTVLVETPVGKPIGPTMNAIRSWLDSQKIQTTAFKIVPTARGLGFEIAFGQEHEAQRFRQEFAADA
jgi:hypothetical protein